jgi:hypothetical protein
MGQHISGSRSAFAGQTQLHLGWHLPTLNFTPQEIGKAQENRNQNSCAFLISRGAFETLGLICAEDVVQLDSHL